MNQHVYKFAMALLVAAAVAGCVTQKEVVSSQTQSNWAQADPEAMTSAEPEDEREIMPDTHFAAGQLFEKQGGVHKAIVQYQKSLAGNPNHVAALNRLGVLYSGMGRHADAEAALRRAVELDPDSSSLRNDLGFEYIMQQKWAKAETEFRQAIAMSPDFRRAHINLGLCLAKLGRFDESLEKFRAVLPAPDAYYNLGLMLRAEHRYRDAADAFELALEINPKFVAARKQLDQMGPQLRLSTELEPTLDAGQLAAMAVEPDAPEAPDAAIPSPVIATEVPQEDEPPLIVAVVDVIHPPHPAGDADVANAMVEIAEAADVVEVVDVADVVTIDPADDLVNEDDADTEYASLMVSSIANVFDDDCHDDVMTLARFDALGFMEQRDSDFMHTSAPVEAEPRIQALTGDMLADDTLADDTLADDTLADDTLTTVPVAAENAEANAAPETNQADDPIAIIGAWNMVTQQIRSFIAFMVEQGSLADAAAIDTIDDVRDPLANLPSDLLPFEKHPLFESSWK